MLRRRDTPLSTAKFRNKFRILSKPIKSHIDANAQQEAGIKFRTKSSENCESCENDENRKANFIDDDKSLQTKESKTDR